MTFGFSQVLKTSSIAFLVVFILACSTSFKSTSEPVDLRWKVDSEQYLLYDAGQQTDVFDVFGYELSGDRHPVPHPALVHTADRLPAYLSLFLPHRSVRINQAFSYERQLNPGHDSRFVPYRGLMPAVVRVEGKVGNRTKLNGHEVMLIHQSIRVDTPDPHVRAMKEKYNGNWLSCSGGKVEVKQWFDPQEGIVRRFKYTSSLRFTPAREETGEIHPKRIETENTWTITDVRQMGKREGERTFRQRVEESIEKGVEFLKKKQKANGEWAGADVQSREKGHMSPSGRTALALLALMECGVRRENSVVKQGMDRLLNMPLERTRSIALGLMALEKSTRGKLAEQESQKFGKMLKTEELTKNERIWIESQVKQLLKTMMDNGGWGYKMGVDQTNSVSTTYGVYGLNASSRLGAMVPTDVWKRNLAYWLERQQRDGSSVTLSLGPRGKHFEIVSNARARGWRFKTSSDQKIFGDPHSVRHAMTFAGIGSVQSVLTYLAKMNRLGEDVIEKGRQSIRDGLAWLQSHWTLRPSPHPNGTENRWTTGEQYRSLFFLEQAGMYSRIRSIVGHDWYREGVEMLLSRQLDSGAWTRSRDVQSTCFALLFLNRAHRAH